MIKELLASDAENSDQGREADTKDKELAKQIVFAKPRIEKKNENDKAEQEPGSNDVTAGDDNLRESVSPAAETPPPATETLSPATETLPPATRFEASSSPGPRSPGATPSDTASLISIVVLAAAIAILILRRLSLAGLFDYVYQG